jgi:hypothetical protein
MASVMEEKGGGNSPPPRLLPLPLAIWPEKIWRFIFFCGKTARAPGTFLLFWSHGAAVE